MFVAWRVLYSILYHIFYLFSLTNQPTLHKTRLSQFLFITFCCTGRAQHRDTLHLEKRHLERPSIRYYYPLQYTKKVPSNMADDFAACPPPTLQAATTVKFNAGQFVSHRTDKVSKHYSIKSALGSGGYGEVFLATHKESGTERAIKVIDKAKWNSSENEAVINEFNIVKDLDHPVSLTRCIINLAVIILQIWRVPPSKTLVLTYLSAYSIIMSLHFLNFAVRIY